MNQQTFEAGVAAYQSGDWAGAEAYLSRALGEGEVNGRANHLRGNALMKLGRFDDAAAAYEEALKDGSYGRSGALHTNRGRALAAAGRLQEAVESLSLATQDPDYPTPYKAYNALGGAYAALGDIRSAGIAYRNAAIDESNPDPSTALRKLGGCFMDLGRPVDAVEAYRTALDFSSPLQSQNSIYCDLALAYVAANRMPEAVDAFTHATADGRLRLTPEAQASFDAARNAVAASQRKNAPSDTDNLLASVGYGPTGVDPLDPTGETTGNLMPSPEDTGFFSVTEEELMKNDKAERRGKRKKRHTGRKVFLTILIILLVLAAAGGFAYYRGYGWPTQETVVQGLFDSKTNQGDVEQYVSSSLSDTDRATLVALVPAGASVQITNVDRSMDSSTVGVTATLSDGDVRSFQIDLVRDGIGWKVDRFSLTGSDATSDTGTDTSSDASADTSSTDASDTTSSDASASTGDTTTSSDTTTTSGSIS